MCGQILERLKAVRKAKSLLLYEVADCLGIDWKLYRRYETGRFTMPADLLYQFCLYYELSADYLLGLPKGLSFPDYEDIDALKETEDKSWKQIACNLKKARILKGVTQSQVSEYLGIHRSFYTEYEIGASTLPIDLLYQLCLYYDISADYLLGLPKGLPFPDDEE